MSGSCLSHRGLEGAKAAPCHLLRELRRAPRERASFDVLGEDWGCAGRSSYWYAHDDKYSYRFTKSSWKIAVRFSLPAYGGARR